MVGRDAGRRRRPPSPRARTRRNTVAFGLSAAALAAVIAYPTSTNRGGTGRVSVAAGSNRGEAVFDGVVVPIRYGDVQVRIRVRAGRIVAATALSYPSDNDRDRQINSRAVPLLQQQTIQTQGAQIDTVSGATFTSEGYRTSLQAALDAAHLAE